MQGNISKIDYKTKRVLVDCADGHRRCVRMHDVFVQPTFVSLDAKLRSDANRAEMLREIQSLKTV